MNKIFITLSALVLSVLSFSSCRDFDEVNRDPLAAHRDQVLSEYLINRAMMTAQQDPHIAERAFVRYWKNASHQQREGSLSLGGVDDSWSGDYYSRMTTESLKPLYQAIAISEEKIRSGSAKAYEPTLLAVARVWRAYMLSEICDLFGVAALEGYTGQNPTYASTQAVYTFILKELQEAAETLKTSPTPTEQAVTKLDHAYGFNASKWRRYANSLRMRLSMRLSEVEPTTARTHFEQAAAEGGILRAEDRLQVAEQRGWHDLSGVMSREWNAQNLSATYNNLVVGLGGITSARQLTDARYQPYLRAENYLGVRYDKHFPLMTTDPMRGFYFDGLPGKIDPRAYKTFIVTGDTLNSEFCFYPSWATHRVKQTKYKLSKVDNPKETLVELDTRFTWNAWVSGAWGELSGINDVAQIGAMPRLAQKYRASTSVRIFFPEWETYFLLAEAAVRGWSVSMSAKDAYEAGVRASFAYHGAGFVDEYLTSQDYNRVGTSVAWDHTTEPAATRTMECVNGYTQQREQYTYHYPEAKSRLYKAAMNDHLTKIITQKFIANVPWLPLESWSDHRRLGLPFFETPAVEKPLDNMLHLTKAGYETASIDYYPQRLPLPSNISSTNKPGHASALQALGGPDGVFTPLYWAKKKQ
nr:SusD/RagB family nutrient-binding outer membrane lipoprotein [uncultured Porphyromonas sp.]